VACLGKRRAAERHPKRRAAASTMFFFKIFTKGISAPNATQHPDPDKIGRIHSDSPWLALVPMSVFGTPFDLCPSHPLFAVLTFNFIAFCVDFYAAEVRRILDVGESRHQRLLSFASLRPLRFQCLLVAGKGRAAFLALFCGQSSPSPLWSDSLGFGPLSRLCLSSSAPSHPLTLSPPAPHSTIFYFDRFDRPSFRSPVCLHCAKTASQNLGCHLVTHSPCHPLTPPPPNAPPGMRHN